MKSEPLAEIAEKIKSKAARVGIVGLGYVGLPLALAFSESGFQVLGFDIQRKRVGLVNRGSSYIDDVEGNRLSAAVSKNRLLATMKRENLAEVDAICVCVPTPLTETKDPDLSYVIHEVKRISKYLQPGQLVILESTTYPGTTREVVLPILERSGLRVGDDFYLAYSPERVDPGNKKYTIKNIPKIVGGIEPKSAELGSILYQQIADEVIKVSSSEVAEMTKVFENVFRNVNIALVNELAQLCEMMSMSVWEVIEAAATKPFGYIPFYPGPGVGGHCIPVDPYYLAAKARELDFHTRFIELSAEINERMPYYVTSKIAECLNDRSMSLKEANVFLLGMAYKKDTADLRESASLKLLEILLKKGAQVSYNDPYIPSISCSEDTLDSVELSSENLASADCVVLATNHSCYDINRVVSLSKLVFDTTGNTRGMDSNNIARLGE